jgi:hypothetical protein
MPLEVPMVRRASEDRDSWCGIDPDLALLLAEAEAETAELLAELDAWEAALLRDLDLDAPRLGDA